MPRSLVVAPAWDAGDDLVRDVVGAGGRALRCRAHSRSTGWPRSWRRRVLARDGRVPVTDLGFVAVTARAVHRLLAENAFEYYEPVADRPGFPPAVARTLGELRMNGVEARGAATARRTVAPTWRGSPRPSRAS